MDLGGFGGPDGPPHFLTFWEKKGAGEETEKSRILLSTGGGLTPPPMSFQDVSLGLVWKCIALTRQAAGFRLGAAYL